MNDLTTLPEGSVLVLDDYHVIDDPAVHKALTDLLPLLARWQARAEAHKRYDSVLHILMLRVLALDAEGDSQAALAHLADALRLAAPEGYLRLFIEIETLGVDEG